MPAPSLSISSSRNTGFFVPALRRPWSTLPGSAPMYVRRWPRISASSCTPPSDTRTNLRPIARAIDWPSEVLPTPGGPTRQRFARFPSGLSWSTARYSRIARFTFSSPWWSASSTSRARSRSRLSGVIADHGSSETTSRYVRSIEYSAADSFMRSRRANSLNACLRASSGSSAFSSAARSPAMSPLSPVPPWSSFWICFNCSRRKYSRCALLSSPAVSWRILCESLSTCESLPSFVATLSSRAWSPTVSSRSCFSASGMSRNVDTMSASIEGDVMPAIAFASSSGAPGASWSTSCACCLSARKRASSSGVRAASSSSMRSNSPSNRSFSSKTPFKRKRCVPWQIAWCLPSGAVR